MYLLSPFFWIVIWLLILPYYLSTQVRTQNWILILSFFIAIATNSSWSSGILLFLLVTITFLVCHVQKNKWTGFFLFFLLTSPFIILKLNLFPSFFETQLEMPLGLSFVTLSCVAYIVDVWKQRTPSPTDKTTFLSSSLFFSTIASGPILVIQDISNQIRAFRAWNKTEFQFALLLILNGLFKKNIGDLVSSFAVRASTDFIAQSVIDRWIGFIATGAEFYADFSGYSDIAIGLGLLFGIRLPENFKLPYLTQNISEFWSKWHMSLTTWSRNYIFFPVMQNFLHVFGRSQPTLITLVSVFASMLFIGFWHDPGILFFVWAGYQTLLISLSPFQQIFSNWVGRRWSLFILLPLNFIFIVIGYLFFRLPNVTAISSYVQVLFRFQDFRPLTHFVLLDLLLVISALVLPHFIDYQIQARRNLFLNPAVWCLFVTLCAIFCISIGSPHQPFIYSRF